MKLYLTRLIFRFLKNQLRLSANTASTLFKNSLFAFASGILFTTYAFANLTPTTTDFQGKNACFIVLDLNENKIIEKYHSERCAESITPASTFKVPLSLMAFDQHLINQNTVFKWDGQDKGLAAWNHDQTPQSWLQNSVVWVSQSLTPKLGMEKIKTYLKEFDYGNQDFSGDPGKNNGLTHAWLGSSLKISPDQELKFMSALVKNQLPISQAAMTNTKNNMYLSQHLDAKLYGKTGTAIASDSSTPPLQYGWLVGFLEKANHTYVVILSFTDTQTPPNNEPAGTRAKTMTEALLRKMGLF